MVHQYQLNGYNIVLDSCSGAIHVVDEVAYDIIAMYQDKTADEIVAQIIEKSPVQFMGGQIPLDLTDTSEEGLWALQSFTGLSTAEKLKEAAVFESMTGSQAFSLVVVRVKEAADAKSVAEQMKENINPRKWICVGADEKIVAGYGDTVMLIMLDSQLGLSAQSYVDAFGQVAGADLDFVM